MNANGLEEQGARYTIQFVLIGQEIDQTVCQRYTQDAKEEAQRRQKNSATSDSVLLPCSNGPFRLATRGCGYGCRNSALRSSSDKSQATSQQPGEAACCVFSSLFFCIPPQAAPMNTNNNVVLDDVPVVRCVVLPITHRPERQTISFFSSWS